MTSKETNLLKNSTFHPFEFAICGFSGSGKTTLIEKLVRLSKRNGNKVSVVKHDAHEFEMDKQGKDSYILR